MSARRLMRTEINCGSADISSLRQNVFSTLSSLGHSGRTSIHTTGGSPRYSAHTTIVDQSIEMRLDPDQSFIPAQKRLMHFLSQKGLAEPVIQLGSALARHEAVHTGALVEGNVFGCPGTLENHYEMFVEEIINALEKKGKPASAASYLANLIQDLIDNYACQKTGSMDADMLFMYAEGMEKGKYTRIYEAFSKLYAFINGKNEWNGLLSQFYGNDAEVNNAVRNIVRELGLERGRNDRILDQKNWRMISSVMASHLADLIEYDSSGAIIIMHVLPGGEHNVEPPPPELPYKRYLEGQPLPRYMHADDALWDIYWELAGKIEITAEGELRSMDLPCIPIAHEGFDPQRHDIWEADPFSPVFSYGRFDMGVPKHRLSIDVPLKERKEGYPRLNIACLDRSGSMELPIDGGDKGAQEAIPWGDRSKYHFLYLGTVAIVKGLYDRGILEEVELGGIFFGSSSESVSGIDALKRTLSNPEFQGSTELDIESIRESLGDEPSVFMTISDGHIGNWRTVKKQFIELMKQNYYFHIQIGEETEMTHSLRKAGFRVLVVQSGEELVQGMTRVTLEIMDQHNKKREY